MIFLYERPVIEAETVVVAAAHRDCVFFKISPTRCCLPGINYPDPGSCNTIRILSRQGRYAGEALEKVEGRAFSFQKDTEIPGHFQKYRPFCDPVAIFIFLPELDLWIKRNEDLARNIKPGQDHGFLGHDFPFAGAVRVHHGISGNIAGPDIFFKSGAYQSVNGKAIKIVVSNIFCQINHRSVSKDKERGRNNFPFRSSTQFAFCFLCQGFFQY